MSANWIKGVVSRQSSQELQPLSQRNDAHSPSPSASVRAASIRDGSLAEAADHVSTASTAVLSPQPLARSPSLHNVSQIPAAETRPLAGAIDRMTNPHSAPPTPQDRSLVTAVLNDKVDPAAPKREKQYSTLKKVILVASLSLCLIGAGASFGSGVGAIGGVLLLGTALLIGFIYRDELKEIGFDIKDKLASIFSKKTKPQKTAQHAQPASTSGQSSATSSSRASLISGVASSPQPVSVEAEKERLEIQLAELESKKTLNQSEHKALAKEFLEIDDEIVELDVEVKQIEATISRWPGENEPDRKAALLARKTELEEQIEALTEKGQKVGERMAEHERTMDLLETEVAGVKHQLVSLMPPPPISAEFLGASPLVTAREQITLDRSKIRDISTPEEAVDLADVPNDSFDIRPKGSPFTTEEIEFHQTYLQSVKDELNRAEREVFKLNGMLDEQTKLLKSMGESSPGDIARVKNQIKTLEGELSEALKDHEYAKGVVSRFENDEVGLYLKEVEAEKARQLQKASFTGEEIEAYQEEMAALKAGSDDFKAGIQDLTEQIENKKKELTEAEQKYQANPASNRETWNLVKSLRAEVSSLESSVDQMKKQADAYDQLQKEGAASLIGQYSARMELEEASTRHLTSMSSSSSMDSLSEDEIQASSSSSPPSRQASPIGDLVSEQGKIQRRFEKSLDRMRDLKEKLNENGALLVEVNQAKNLRATTKAKKQQAGENTAHLETKLMELQKRETELKKERMDLVNQFMDVANSHSKWLKNNPSKVKEILSAQNLNAKDAVKRAVRKERLEKISNFVAQFSREFENAPQILRFSTQTVADLKSIVTTLRASLVVTDRKDNDTVDQITEYLTFRRLEIMSKIDVSKMLSIEYRSNFLRADIVLDAQINLELANDKKHKSFEKWMKIAENLYQKGDLHDANLIYTALQARKSQVERQGKGIGNLETGFGQLKKHYDDYMASDKQPRPGVIIPLSEITKKLIQPSEIYEGYVKKLENPEEMSSEEINSVEDQLTTLISAQATLLQGYFSGHVKPEATSRPAPTAIEKNLLLARAHMETI